MSYTKDEVFETLVKIPQHLMQEEMGNSVELSPFDLATRGKPIPMVWFYADTLNTAELLASLEQALAICPVFCGRYADSSPSAINLNNAGTPVAVARLEEGEEKAREATVERAVDHVPNSPSATLPSLFVASQIAAFLPNKEGMADPDRGDSGCPLVKIKITHFSSTGTAIGILAQHGIVDAEAQILFMRIWSQVFRKQEPNPLPIHERCIVLNHAASTGEIERPSECNYKSLPQNEPSVPEFLSVAPRIFGASACLVPFTRDKLAAMKETASARLPPGEFVSTDDIATALTWQAQCAVRCKQLELLPDSIEVTTCARAWNFRMRTHPPLGKGYFANGVSHVWTRMPVHELLSMPVSGVALRLRKDLRLHTSATVSTRAAWLRQEHRKGMATTQTFDKHALTIIISSWMFEWEAADFNSPPLCYEHAAHVPFVSVFVPRPNGDGLNVSASGTEEAVQAFAQLMTAEIQ